MKISKVLVSPNKRYMCNIGKLEELNKGAFGAKFDFSDYQGKVLYYMKGTYLHELILEDNKNMPILLDDFILWTKENITTLTKENLEEFLKKNIEINHLKE